MKTMKTWMVVLLLVGVGFMLALWVQEGAPGGKVLIGLAGAWGVIGLLSAMAGSKRGMTTQMAGVAGVLLLALAGAWWLLMTLAGWIGGML